MSPCRADRHCAPAAQEDEATRPAQFYDNWVTRDADGDLFTMVPPYATDPYSRARISRGLHFPVKCCWNGMVALNAAPFLRHGVRVRCACVKVCSQAGGVHVTPVDLGLPLHAC